MSERDWAGIKERRAFEQAEREKQRLVEDREQYQEYVRVVNADQQRVPPRFKVEPLDFDAWRAFTDTDQADPVLRGHVATNRALLTKVNQAEEQANEELRQSILAGKPDLAWRLPKSARGLRMSGEQAKQFVKTESRRFVDETPEYQVCKGNYERIISYLMAQKPDVMVPNADCFRFAFNRLRELGLLEERAPSPQPEPVEEEPITKDEAPSSDLVDGWDIETGEPRQYTQREINKMSSDEFRIAFKMWARRDGDFRPKFTRGFYQ